MKKLSIIIYIFCCFLFNSKAGVYQDSIVNIIKFSKNDSIIMVNEMELSYSTAEINIDSALGCMKRALHIAHEKGYGHYKGIILKELGVQYYNKSSYNLALDYLKESQDVLNTLEKNWDLGNTLFYQGLIYSEMGNYDLSIDYYYKALQLYELAKDSVSIARVLNNIGVNLEAINEYKGAYKLYLKSFNFKKQANDYHGIATGYINLGNTKLKLGDVDSSMYFHKLALQAANLLRSDRIMIEALNCLGNDYIEINKPHQAIEMYEKAMSRFNKHKNTYQLSSVYNGLAKAYFIKGETKKALSYVQYNINNLKNLRANDMLKDAYLLLADIRNSIGDYNEAYEAMKEYAMVKDSIYNSEKLSAIAETQEKYNANKKQKEIETLIHQNELNQMQQDKQQLYLTGLIIFSVVLSVFLGFVFSMYKQRKKVNEQLNQSLKEKEVLIKEVHHRVKNNFQLISSLLNLQSDLIKDKEALNAITEGRNRIASMALVHKNLYMTQDLTSIEMQQYIQQLLESIISTSEKGDVQITYEFDAGNISFDVDTSVPIGLIINELLTNSIKYAFVGRGSGIVSLKMRHIEGDKYEMIYSDNGIGLPDDLDLDNLTSLGLELVQLLVAQLNGNLSYFVDEGTKFKISFNKA